MGQYNVRVEKSAGVKGDIYQSEAAHEAAVTEKIYDLTNPLSRRKYLQIRDLPEIDEPTNKQIERAEEVVVTFCERYEVPAANPTVHACDLWYRVLGLGLFDDRVRKIEQVIGWNKLLPQIAEWEEELARLEVKYRDSKAAYQSKGIPLVRSGGSGAGECSTAG
jgi:hypothetical protein